MARTTNEHQLVYALPERTHCSPSKFRRPMYRSILGGRFGSQALLDEAALAAAMAYVDLNPIRAKMAETPETSDHTSIQKRIRTLKNSKNKQQIQQPNELMPFIGNPRKDMPKGLPFRLDDYLNLVDWTGRSIRLDKTGAIPNNLSPIFERLNINPESWLELSKTTKTILVYLLDKPIEWNKFAIMPI